MEKKTVYFQDELNDDFAGNKIVTKKIPNDYKYVRKSLLFKINSFLLRYLLAVPILWLVDTLFFGVKIENKRIFKYFKKQGYYVYCNHVLPYDPVILPVKATPRKGMVIVASHDLFSINWFVSWLVRHFLAIPIPNADKQMNDNYRECLSYHVKKGRRVLIYPEAHIWPYYNDIRKFKSSSFRYPIDDHTPIFTATTVFKKRKGKRKPKPIIYIDGPFYPDENLNYREQVDDLANKAYEAMCYRAHNDDNYAYIDYKKKSD